MPSKSKAQHNFMAAVANNPSFAKKAGVPQSVGKEFNNADKGKTFKQGGDMKKMNMGGYADGGMPMKNGKPAFVGDGKGAMKKGGMAKKMAGGGIAASSMGKVKTAAPSRDGIAMKGKTKGTQIKMAGYGVPNGVGIQTMKRGGKA
jgi:hypothetical protein